MRHLLRPSHPSHAATTMQVLFDPTERWPPARKSECQMSEPGVLVVDSPLLSCLAPVANLLLLFTFCPQGFYHGHVVYKRVPFGIATWPCMRTTSALTFWVLMSLVDSSPVILDGSYVAARNAQRHYACIRERTRS